MRARPLLVLAFAAACERGTPAAKQGSHPTTTVVPGSCVDEAAANQQVADAEARAHAAFSKALADRGLVQLSVAPVAVDEGEITHDKLADAQIGKKGVRLLTDCSMSTGCCSDRPDPSTLGCRGGGSEPALYKDSSNTAFLVHADARVALRQVTICGAPPPDPCPEAYHGCGCPDHSMPTYVTLPADVTYGGELAIAYDTEQLQLVHAGPAPAPSCPR